MISNRLKIHIWEKLTTSRWWSLEVGFGQSTQMWQMENFVTFLKEQTNLISPAISQGRGPHLLFLTFGCIIGQNVHPTFDFFSILNATIEKKMSWKSHLFIKFGCRIGPSLHPTFSVFLHVGCKAGPMLHPKSCCFLNLGAELRQCCIQN